jgi:hypothetical protein
MSFANDLTGFTAADLIYAFPGIPRSTAYDWLAGTREPVSYLQPVALAHVRRSIKKKSNKTLDGTPRKRSGKAEI